MTQFWQLRQPAMWSAAPVAAVVRTAQLRCDVLEARAVPNAGVLDATFGQGGLLFPAKNEADSNITAVTPQPDGKVLLARASSVFDPPGVATFRIERFDAVGRID